MTGALLFSFWLEASGGVGWADAALAFTAAVIFVLAIILVRVRREGDVADAADVVCVFTRGSRTFWSDVRNFICRCQPAPSQVHHFHSTPIRHGVLRRIDSRDAVALTKAASARRSGTD